MFVVIPTSPDHKLDQVIGASFPKDHYKLPLGQWMISFDGTSKELSDKLGISEGTNGLGVVAAINGYFGRAPTGLWEWMKAKMEKG